MASSRRPPRPRPGAPRPAASWTTPGAGALRTKIELASRGPLVRMHAAPRWALFLAFLGLAVGAALAPGGWDALCAVVLATFLSWLLFLAWVKLTPATRALRLVVIAILLGAAIVKIALG